MKVSREPLMAVPWLGILSADWPLVPLRYLVRFLSGGTPDKGNADFWSGGTIPWVSPKDMKVDRIDDSEDHITAAALDSSATQLVPVGSVLVVVRGMILAHTLPVAVTIGPVTINQDIKALVCGQRILPEFLHAVLAGQAEWLLSQTDSSAHGTKKLETEVLQRFDVPCPPLELQRRIVATMRAQAMGLDEVVASKRRVLNLLAEKRKAIIATAVTRGLAQKARLRDSGVPWIGQIPEHWDVRRLKFHLDGITQGWSPQCEALPAGPDDWGVLKAGCVNGDSFNAEENKRLPDSETPIPDIEVRPRDVVMSRANTTELVGSAAIAPADVRPRLMLSDKLYRLNVRTDELLPELLVYFVRTSSGRFEFERTASGASNSMQNISQEVVRNIWVPIPPLDEQSAIVDYIARETAKLDAVRAATERTIALLKERRAALIAAAVTGQLDVGAAA